MLTHMGFGAVSSGCPHLIFHSPSFKPNLQTLSVPMAYESGLGGGWQVGLRVFVVAACWVVSLCVRVCPNPLGSHRHPCPLQKPHSAASAQLLTWSDRFPDLPL